MSAVSKMSLTPNGTPLSSIFLPDLSRSRAWVNAASPARWLHARTTGSRSAIRARQLATTDSAVSSPASIRRTRVVAARRFGSAFGMAGSSAAGGEPHLATMVGTAHPGFHAESALSPAAGFLRVAPPVAAINSTAVRSKLGEDHSVESTTFERDDAISEVAAGGQHRRTSLDGRPVHAHRGAFK